MNGFQVILIRASTECRQYCFAERSELEAWLRRYPYRDEAFRVLVFVPGELASVDRCNVAATDVVGCIP